MEDDMKFSEMKGDKLGDILLVSVEDEEFDVLGPFGEDESVESAIARAVAFMNEESAKVNDVYDTPPWPANPETDAGWLPDGLTIYHPNGFQAVIAVSTPAWRIENLWVPEDDAAEGANWRRELSANEAHELVLHQIEDGWIDPETGELPKSPPFEGKSGPLFFFCRGGVHRPVGGEFPAEPEAAVKALVESFGWTKYSLLSDVSSVTTTVGLVVKNEEDGEEVWMAIL
jgi:hypothetical protein